MYSYNLNIKLLHIISYIKVKNPAKINSGVGNYLNVINQLPESVNKALLVGHNPTISDLVNYLSDTYEVDLPTAGFVKLALLSDTWEGVGSGIASIEWVKVPENQI